MTTSRTGRHFTAPLAAVLAIGVLLPAAPARAQAFTDFGITTGEDVLAGGAAPANTRANTGAVTGTVEIRRGAARLDGFESDLLETGGSVRIVPDFELAFRAEPRVANRYRALSPSVLQVVAQRPNGLIRGTGAYANAQGRDGGSFASYGSPAFLEREAGPKIIDVAHELSQRSHGRDPVSVEWSGSTKIIRLAERRTEAHERPLGKDEHGPEHLKDSQDGEARQSRGQAVVPTPASQAPTPTAAPAAPAPSPAQAAPAESEQGEAPDAARVPVPESAPTPAQEAGPEAVPASPGASVPPPAADETQESEPGSEDAQTTAPFLEPWTDEWLAACVERYDDFDASLGTYTDEDGRRRFCTGEAG